MRNSEALDRLRADVVQRWRIPDWDALFPWRPRPATVKILFYADGSIAYDGGPFLGLKQVLATLSADPYPWVQFEITTVHRGMDPSADHEGLDLAQALALDDFDELWIYSILSGPGLSGTELAAASAFMDAHHGGVLITGDHADLGAAFGNLPRAGKMRQLPAPPAAPPLWNDSLRTGADAIYEFDDQSDDTPQPLELKKYWGGLLWKRPHQVLCSPLGPIDIFPDHQHEGEALAPAANPVSEWPGGLAAEVIAQARIEDPDADVGRRFGVLSAYQGHQVGVGRILADSTWHHHFDINLRGLPGVVGRSGFVTPGTDDWLPAATKIEHYYVNAAIWLAPPAAQSAMRWAAWWSALWSDRLVQLHPKLTPVRLLGRAAYDALGRHAPQCLIFEWIWDLVAVEARPAFLELLNRPDPPPPIVEHIAGAVTRELMATFGVGPDAPGFPRQAPDADPAELDKRLREAARVGVADLVDELDLRAKALRGVLGRM